MYTHPRLCGVGLASALSVAEAVTEALHNGAPMDAIAEAIADATSVDRDTIEEYLRRNDTEALAHAIASSQGGHTYADVTSVAEVRFAARHIRMASMMYRRPWPVRRMSS